MRKFLAIVLTYLIIGDGWSQSHGLQFLSHEVVQEKRTSLHLTPSKKICIGDRTEISFDLNFSHGLETYFGYIIRIITDDRKNIDIVYNQRLLNFNFVIGEDYNGVFEIDLKDLTNKWCRVKIILDASSRKASLYIDNVRKLSADAAIQPGTCLDIIFGTSDKEGFQTVDIPPMRIRNVAISINNKAAYEWNLSESTGAVAHDRLGGQPGLVKNPVWIKLRHQQWQSILRFDTKGTAPVAFDPKTEKLFIVSIDSIYSVNINSGTVAGKKLVRSRNLLLPGNQAIYDTQSNKLYNFYFDQKIVSEYNEEINSWSHNFQPGLLTEYWHVNNFISAADSSLYIVGGYGQLRYKNSVWRYHLPTHRWDSIAVKGDFFMPRYLAAAGSNKRGDTAFVMGGYGSNTGDQAVNPRFNYELLSFDVERKKFRSIYNLPKRDQQFCFANNLVVDADGKNFYSLVYPTDRFNSSLQLFRGSLTEPEYQIFGDSIPYPFHDIQSFANLYFAPLSKKFLAVTLFTSKDSITTVKIYTLDFPPNEPLTTGNAVSKNQWLAMATGIFGILGLLYFFIKLKRKPAYVARNPQENTIGAAPKIEEPFIVRASNTGPGIYLFGEFHVIDRSGDDISKLFTPLLKELFLLIVTYTFRNGKGISSDALNEMLWHDKAEKDAKNNRSVNLAKLKTIIEKIGNCQISKETGFWQFQNKDPNVYVDYQNFTALQSTKPFPDKEYIIKLLNITQQGSFLMQTEYNWLDDIKSEISNTVIDQCSNYLEREGNATEAELVIEICNCIFMFDRLNEQALEYKCRSLIALKRHALANTSYLKFVKEYNEIYQEEFPRSFNDIIR